MIVAKIKTFKMKVYSIVQETPDTRTLRFRFGPGEFLDFKPGQFAMVKTKICHDDITEDVERPLSIASSPTRLDYIEFTIKEVPGGIFSNHILNKCKEKDIFEIKAPYGQFFFSEGMADEIILLAAGSGVVPFMSMIRYICDKKLPVKVTLIDSNKTPDDIIFHGELKILEKENSNLRVVNTITRPEGTGWTGLTGRVDKNLLQRYRGKDSVLYYICGPPPFTDAVIAMLKEMGVDSKKIKIERFH